MLKFVSAGRPPAFSGLGVVFYQSLDSLPRLSLGGSETPLPQLPISGIGKIADTLAGISDYKSPWHDGFHLVDVSSWTLTQLSQFLSPPLPDHEREIGVPRPAGARHMTALLVSRIPGIVCVGLLTQAGEINLFENGIQTINIK